ncbi:SDR family oxidoreductase [Aliiglaciecola sp. LCG003]|uniref:SDR family oxidoreductase n=1 Tax=Aliiglaciecola sp. LCG003 TaxID=3053655 RepID=UPI0025736E83|nr:SDR family oxidoreductase [Aliiglaciecola sp. LCG003]WJG10772.1 SDR family oxidoreductase [Aliiglaciecola sp. LCG003]
MKQQHQFDNKVVVITGAAAGIGAATALAFAEQGAKVILADIDPLGETVAEQIRAKGGQGVFQRCDLTDTGSTARLFTFISENFGAIDMAFNNAGIDIETTKLADGTEADFDNIMNINVKGVWLCMQHEIKSMLKSGRGAIVNTASIAGLGAAPKMSIYSASKHAVIGLTKSAAIEYAKKGIRVNAVCPAVIDTNMYRRALAGDPRKEQAISAMHPIGRVGSVDEVVAAVMYLCSDSASFSTGVALPVDGGSTAI